MNKKSILLATLACSLIALASTSAYWKYSAFISLGSVSTAIENQNAAHFETYMDYHRLRESIARQLRMKLTESVQAGRRDVPSPDLHSQNGSIAAIADAAIRPEALMRALATGSSSALFPPEAIVTFPVFADLVGGGTFTGWKLDHTDPNIVRAYATFSGEKTKQALSFVFQRKGFADWKIVEVVLPTVQRLPGLVQGSTSTIGFAS